MDLLAEQKSLPERYCNHRLVGNFEGTYECHVKPDWLLIYEATETELRLIRTGSHSDLF